MVRMVSGATAVRRYGAAAITDLGVVITTLDRGNQAVTSQVGRISTRKLRCMQQAAVDHGATFSGRGELNHRPAPRTHALTGIRMLPGIYCHPLARDSRAAEAG